VIDPDKNESLFYENTTAQSPLLRYALNSGNFVCVTTSGIVNSNKIYVTNSFAVFFSKLL